MTKINWKVRLANPTFWLTIVPAVALLVEGIAKLFGLYFDVVVVESALTDVINAIFAVLAVAGVAIDHTTEGVGDSERALSYDKPASHINEEDAE